VDAKAASAGRRSARRRWAGRSLQAALVLVSVCAVAAGSAWMQRPRERARLTSIPPPADPEVAHEAPPAVDAVAHHEPASADAAVTADAAARAAAPAVASHATDVALERAIWFGRLGEAERMLLAAIAAQPRDATAHARLGFVRFQRGNLRGALLAYRAASEIDRVNVSYLRSLARLQESTGDRAGAVRSLRSLLALAPRDAAARSSLQRLGGA